MTTLTDAEREALAIYDSRFSSRDTVLAAVRAAVSATERRFEQSEDHRIAVLESVMVECRDMIRRFDTPGDRGRTQAFVTDLSRILDRASRTEIR